MASSSSTSLSLPPLKEDEVMINWAELPQELTSAIMLRLSAMEKLESAQRVCTSWLRACKHPLNWQKIDMRSTKTLLNSLATLKLLFLGSRYKKLEAMCRHAIDLSQGGLLEIKIQYFGTSELLTYIADRSSNLRSLELADCHLITSLDISKAVLKLPLLEELNLWHYSTNEQHLKAIGQACPNLKVLKLNFTGGKPPRLECDDDALAIAETMPGLYHLELSGNRLSDIGLNAILDNCPHLEHLDLSQCLCINLVGDLEKKCFERIKHVIRPTGSTADDPYYPPYDDYGYGSDDDYGYGSDEDSVHCGVFDDSFHYGLGATSDDDMYGYYDD